jgi:phosphate transport system substrate-binding protein
MLRKVELKTLLFKMDKVYLLCCISRILYWHDLDRISLDLFRIYQASKIMTQKNETIVLVITVLITTGLAGAAGAVFWRFNNVPAVFNSNNELKTESLANNQSKPANTETLASVQNVPKGLFNYGGSTTWAPIRGKVDSAIQTVWPQFRLRYTQPNIGTVSSGSGIRMLLDNELSFAQSSTALQDKDYDQAKQRGFTLKEIPVAIDAFAVVVNPSLNISGLSVDRLNDIFAGKVTNWNQVGGPNLKIKAYKKGSPESGSHLEFVATTTEALNKVATEPG